jgi:3-dehydroquinate synthase
MDEHGLKNFVGTFAPPHAVLVDFDFLKTLSATHWRGGIAEAFKVAIIKDAAFFRYLEKNAANLRRRDTRAMEQLVRRCAILHLDHIRAGGDPFEMGSARPLDFGHWSAHKLELLSGYALGHGQAVAIGIALDSAYAAARGLLTLAERDRIVAALERAGLPVWSDLLVLPGRGKNLRVLEGLDEFREHLGGRLAVTLPRGIGARVEVHAMNQRVLRAAIRWLKRWDNSSLAGLTSSR